MPENNPYIAIDIIAKKIVHHYAVVILYIFIWKSIFVKNPVSEEIHVEGNKADK